MTQSIKTNIVITCEHAGNKIPKFLQDKLNIPQKVLKSHYAYDIGAFNVAKALSKKISPLFFFHLNTRLIIDYNRSENNKNLWSIYSNQLDPKIKNKLFSEYLLYRKKIKDSIHKKIQKKHFVYHLAIHSFTPIMNQKIRKTEIGLLYDPKRYQEAQFCRKLKSKFSHHFKTHFNLPYRGTSDGLTTHLRKIFPNHYAGIEIEINQKLILKKDTLKTILNILDSQLKEAL